VRIAFIVNEFPVISETFILDQIAGLIAHGCEVDVYAQRILGDAESHPEVRTLALMKRAYSLSRPLAGRRAMRIAQAAHYVGGAWLKAPGPVSGALSRIWSASGSSRLESINRVLPFACRGPYDIVHCHFGPNGILAVALRDMGAFKCPVVTQFHGFDASSYVQEHGENVYRDLFRKGELFLCVSERIRSLILGWGCDARTALVHHTGVKVSQIPFVQRDPFSGGAPRLLSVSRLVEKKGLDFGLRAVARLVQEFPQLEYTVVGDGPERDALTTLAHELRIDNNVRFVGAKTRAEMSAIMADAHVMLTPSIRARSGDEEGIPVVLMEALASGLPVVSTKHAGIPELIVDGVTGLLAPERDTIALAKQVERMLRGPAERLAMIAEGRRSVERAFDSDLLNTQLLGHYRELINRPRT
jgi:colanic acid/amylovoran biosynthesis glycosyltransferase